MQVTDGANNMGILNPTTKYGFSTKPKQIKNGELQLWSLLTSLCDVVIGDKPSRQAKLYPQRLKGSRIAIDVLKVHIDFWVYSSRKWREAVWSNNEWLNKMLATNK